MTFLVVSLAAVGASTATPSSSPTPLPTLWTPQEGGGGETPKHGGGGGSGPMCMTYCQGTCAAWGDIHMDDFRGDAWSIPKNQTEVVLYKLGDFVAKGAVLEVTVPESKAVFDLFFAVSIGDENIEAAELCGGKAGPTKTVTHMFESGGFFSALVTCAQSPRFDLGTFLNVNITKLDKGSRGNDFFQMEYLEGASGECFGPTGKPI